MATSGHMSLYTCVCVCKCMRVCESVYSFKDWPHTRHTLAGARANLLGKDAANLANRRGERVEEKDRMKVVENDFDISFCPCVNCAAAGFHVF